MRINVEFSSMEEVEQFCAKFGTTVNVTNVVTAPPTQMAQVPTEQGAESPKKTRGRPKKDTASTSVDATPEVSAVDTTTEVVYEDVADTPIVTVDELRAALIKLNDKIGTKDVRELIEPYASSCKAQDVPEGKRAELLAKVNEALA